MALTYIAQPARRTREPLLVYLHGAGEVGGDTDQQLRKSGPWTNVLYDPTGSYQPATISAILRFHVLAFHLQTGDWAGEELHDNIADYVALHPEIDPEHLYVTGLSRGGRGALRLALHRLRAGHPVTAVAAFCPAGGADEFTDRDIELLRRVPIYLFHCPEDDVVGFEGTARLHQRIGSGSSRLRSVHESELSDPEGPHNCWTLFYGHPELYQWLEHRADDPADWPYFRVRGGRPVIGAG